MTWLETGAAPSTRSTSSRPARSRAPRSSACSRSSSSARSWSSSDRASRMGVPRSVLTLARRRTPCVYCAPVSACGRSRSRSRLAVARPASSALPLALIVPGLARPESLEPPSTGGMVALHRMLQRLDAHRRVLVIGAHPDDEDTALLALVARGMGGEAAYLSLSRGEGGQNLIGRELGEELGLIRTAGAAGGARRRRRAGSSSPAPSTSATPARSTRRSSKWPKEALLEDTVRVVRRFKPQVIVSIFPTTAEAGTASTRRPGWPRTRCSTASRRRGALPGASEGLPPWRAAALYRSTLLRPTADSLTLADRHHRPGQRQDLLPARDGVAQHAPLAGHGRAAGPRAARDARRLGGWRARRRRRARALPRAGGRRAARAAIRSQQPGPGTQPATVARGDLFAGVDTRLRAIADALDAGPEHDALAASLESRLGARWRRCAPSSRRAISTRPAQRLREIVGAARSGVATTGSRRRSPATSARWRAIWSAEKLELAREALAIASAGCSTPTPSRPPCFPAKRRRCAPPSTTAAPTRRASRPRSERSSRQTGPSDAGEAREVAPGALESWDVAVRGTGRRAADRSLLPRRAAAGRPLRLVGRAGGGARRAVRAADPRPPRSRSRPRARASTSSARWSTATATRRSASAAVRCAWCRRSRYRCSPERVLWPIGADGERTLARRRCASTPPARLRDASKSSLPPGGRRSRRSPFELEASRDSRALDAAARARRARGRRRRAGRRCACARCSTAAAS